MTAPFRLAGVLRWRETQHDAATLEFAAACRDEQALRERLAKLVAEIDELRNRHRELLRGGRVPAVDLQSHRDYETALRRELDALREASRRLAEERETRRQAVVETHRQVELLERLRERHVG